MSEKRNAPGSKRRMCVQNAFFRFGTPPPPSVYLHVGRHDIHMIKRARPFLSVFAYCKLSKTGRREGLGTRLGLNRTKHFF